MRLVIVEPDKARASELASLFTRSKKPEIGLEYDLQTVHSFSEALIVYQNTHPDLVMIALSNDVPGAQLLCQKIRELEIARHTGVIFLASAAAASDEIAVRCLEIGADDVIRSGTSVREIFARTNAVLKLKAMTDELRSANHRLHQLSYTDELTGLANMRAFNGRYSKAVGDCFKAQCGLGVIMMDLDNFKLVNDSTNHLMGSHVISEVGKIIRGAGILKPNDCAARFGGDEYVIFTVDASLEDVRKKADVLLKEIRKAIFIKDGQSIRITTSIGIAWTIPGYKGRAEDPIKAADMMLYKSKAEGRDRVTTMTLRDTVDLDHVCGTHLVDRDTSSDDEDLARIYNF